MVISLTPPAPKQTTLIWCGTPFIRTAWWRCAMGNFRFELLTTSELLDIRDYVDELLKGRTANERREIEKTLARIANATGQNTSSRHASIKGVKIAPKFRNPQTGETWA